MALVRPRRFVNIPVRVEDADRTATFRHCDQDQGRIGGESGNLFFLGLPGSGRRDLARAAAARLGLEYAEAASPDELRGILAGSCSSVAVDGDFLADAPALVQDMRSSGKVFYLVRLPHELAARLGDPSRAEALAADLARLDPVFMNAADFFLTSDETEEERLEDVAMKARL